MCEWKTSKYTISEPGGGLRESVQKRFPTERMLAIHGPLDIEGRAIVWDLEEEANIHLIGTGQQAYNNHQNGSKVYEINR